MRDHARIMEEDIRAQVRAEAIERGYRPDGDPEEVQAYLLLLAAMEKHVMTVAEADAYLDFLFANQEPQAPKDPIVLPGEQA